MTRSSGNAPQHDAADSSRLLPLKQPLYISNRFVQAGLFVTLLASAYSAWISHALPDFAAWSSTLALVLSLSASILLTPRAFAPGYLISMLWLVVAWRVGAMNAVQLMEWITPFSFAVMLVQGIEYAVRDWRAASLRGEGAVATRSWQFTAIRLYFGLNEIGHATEKIFAGKASFHTLVNTFHGFGIGDAAAVFVIVGGLTELSVAISVGLGLFARLGACVSIVYYLVATVGFGHEWSRGYAWAAPGGGGWEYVMLVLIVYLSVTLGGAGKFSIDAWLLERKVLPKPLAWLSGGPSSS